MKMTIALMTMALTLGAFAQEKVELNAKEIIISDSKAIIVRTSKTPSTVKITFMVPMANSICERYETRYELRSSSLHCGDDVIVRRIVSGRECMRINRRGDCIEWNESYREEIIQVPRTCMVPETSCAQYGTATTMEDDKMKVTFKKLPALGGSETETFLVAARQKKYNGENVVYDVKPIKTLRPYKVSQRKILGLGFDSYEISE